ncbi:histidine triad nucleotide-binding protein [Niveibacterium sp. 24ML]|uniref:histidine triad nucleotide-binding protein n=1 Tax=Niveibacterium sp. 24ML TaxID=2985512 RepID=UPI002270984B|nr:histidine triad nucleotide-binding protein [Niveibacterium sp. 24ML]MCX9154866.1 histidine triad nucleotide-binding protein [Niveibacterium sp. 24ML]
MSDCLFCRIVRGEIPATKVYEDELVLAFKDIRPVAPVHLLVIPKRHIESLVTATSDDAEVLGRMFSVIGKIAAEQGATDGFRTIVNSGRVGGQEVYHLHAHVIGGGAQLPAMIKY